MERDAGFRDGKILRIYVDENDRAGIQPLYTAIVEYLRKNGVSGATVFRGIEGFGSHKQVHLARLFSWMPNLPIVIEIVEEETAIEALLPHLRTMIGEGLLTLHDVRFLHLSARKPGREADGSGR